MTTKTCFFICMHVNEFSLIPKLSLAPFQTLFFLFHQSFLSQRERRRVGENRLAFGLCESEDLWNETLSMTETSDRVRTQRSVILPTRRLSRAQFKMIRPHVSETDRPDQGWGGLVSPGHLDAVCGHTRSRLYVLIWMVSSQKHSTTNKNLINRINRCNKH